MIVLTVLACLVSDPAECAWVSIPAEVGPVTCALHGQWFAADWAAEHPKWRVRRWRCGRAEVRS